MKKVNHLTLKQKLSAKNVMKLLMMRVRSVFIQKPNTQMWCQSSAFCALSKHKHKHNFFFIWKVTAQLIETKRIVNTFSKTDVNSEFIAGRNIEMSLNANFEVGAELGQPVFFHTMKFAVNFKTVKIGDVH